MKLRYRAALFALNLGACTDHSPAPPRPSRPSGPMTEHWSMPVPGWPLYFAI